MGADKGQWLGYKQAHSFGEQTIMDRELSTDTSTRDELGELLRQEIKRIREKLSEIKVQVEQTQLVVDREQTRNADIATELRRVQDNIDTTPRPDIRAVYDNALEARFRLTTMSGQLEKFQTTRALLEKQLELMTTVFNLINGGSIALPTDGEAGAASSGPTISIMRIVQAQEEERQRLARQMHDGPAQSLTNFILQTEICQRWFDRNPARAAEELSGLKEIASITFKKVRDFIFDLRPMMLDDLGVVPTVRRYVDSFRSSNDIEVKLNILGEERRLQSHREVMIFRAIQHLMVNARDYATAEEIVINLDLTGNRIKITVEDNGRGFDAEAAMMGDESYQDPRAQSLVTLKQQYELVGGSVAVISGEEDGTSVRLELPASDS
jgi:two-component system sensor histidine kinase DegS